MDRIGIIIFILILLGAEIVAAPGTAKGRILQIKEKRLYFDCGTESLVYPYADFLIKEGTDTIYSGEIEYSLPGVSVSFPSDSIKSLGAYFGNPVEINRAQPDTSGDIDVVITGGLFENFRRLGLFSNSQVKVIEDIRNGRPGQSPDIRIGLQYKKYPEFSRFDSIPAPFYFAMIPDPEKDINLGGILATALYYHYNLYKTGLLVEADGILAYNRHYPVADSTGRIYRYSTVKGGELFRNSIKPGHDIKIFYDYHGLEDFAKYFATFIGRYGSNASFTADSADADLRFVRIPIIPDSLTGSMRAILQTLEESESVDNGLNEKLALIADYLSFVETADKEESEYRYLKMADNILQTEIGIFPLFQPVIYILYKKDIMGDIGIEYDALDFGKISRLRLPVPGKDSL